MSVDIEAPGGNEAALEAALQARVFPAVDTTETAMWADEGGIDPRIWRMRDRVFIGNAALMHKNRAGANTTWMPNSTVGANWIPRDSSLMVMSDVGAIGIGGASRVSDHAGGPTSRPATIGVSGSTINDGSEGLNSWGLYSDLQHEPSAPAQSYGLEVAAKNKALDYTANPYGLSYGVFGLWLAGGGDAAYGGSAANPSNTAIAIIKNSHTWNRGIVFEADALTGTDGVTGAAVAMSLARGHILRWYYAGGNTGASIRSDVDAASSSTSMLFDDNLTSWANSAGKRYFQMVAVASGVNFLNVTQSIASSPVLVAAAGDDTDIDLSLAGKGSGLLRFGTHAGIAAETLSGYITIKDAGGTTRKVAVVS